MPEWDRQIRYIEHKAENFHVVPGRSDNYLLVEITLYAGRSLEANWGIRGGKPASEVDLGFKVEV